MRSHLTPALTLAATVAIAITLGGCWEEIHYKPPPAGSTANSS
jgi:hypothetical protein